MRALLAALAVALATAFGAPGALHAQDRTDHGRPDPSSLTDAQRDELGSLLTRAKAAYEAGNYSESIAALEAAYVILPEPNILYRIGDAYERLGELERSIEYYRRYVTAAPGASDANLISRRIEDLQRRVDELKAEVDQPEVDTSAMLLDTNPTGARVVMDGEVTDHVTPVRIEVEAGVHSVELRLDGHQTLQRDVQIEAGETLSLVYQLDPLPPEPEPAATGPGAWPWVVGGAGVAGLAAGGTLVVASLGNGAKVDRWDAEREAAWEANEPVPERPAEYDATLRREVLFRRAGISSLAAGGVLVGAAVVWLLLDRPGETAVSIGPTGTVRVRFSGL